MTRRRGRPSRAHRDSGFRRRRAAQSRLCRAWRAHDRRWPGRAAAVRVRRRLLHRAERLSLLRLPGACHSLPRLRQSGQTGRRAEPAGRTIRDFRADGRLSARLSAQWLGAVMQAKARGKSAVVGLEPIALVEPKLEECGSLAEAFRLRRTVREFSDEALPPQTLSDLLWAACGINRGSGPFGVVRRSRLG